jgi:ADP-ribose pyrophosphatase
VKEKTLSSEWAFRGRLLHVQVQQVELENGHRSVREMIRHPGAAVVLAQLPDGRFVFVRQYRKPLDKELLEATAGTLKEGEDPESCAHRELEEETGYRARRLSRLGVVYPAPGYTDETLHLFYAELEPGQGKLSPDEDEKLEVVHLTRAEFEALLAKGLVEDAKTLSAWLLFVNRTLRASGN